MDEPLHVRHYLVKGRVQGVGFRPFVHSLASRIALSGFIRNDSRGVVIEVEGAHDRLGAFVDRLRSEAPALAARMLAS